VAFSLAHYGLPAATTGAGLAAGCGAIWLITHQPANGAVPGRALLLGAAAGLGFGIQLVLFNLADASSLLGIMTVARIAGVAALLLMLAWMRPSGARSGYWLTGTIAGIFDTVGNLFYLRAAQLGRLDAAAVICSLYPAGTIVLAGVVLHERPSRRQVAGMVLALAAVALLSLSAQK